MITLGLKFLAAVLRQGDLGAFLALGRLEHLFRESEAPLLVFVDAHIQKHGVLSAVQTFEAHTGAKLPEAPEPLDYYHEHLLRRYVSDQMRDAVSEAAPLLKDKAADPHAAYDLLMDRMLRIAAARRQRDVHDFRDSMQRVMAEYHQRHSGDIPGVLLGWPYLDEMMGGAMPGDLISIVGRPGKGKTWLMAWSAYRAWLEGRRVLFLSMEMSAGAIEQRMAALHAKVPAMDLKLGQLAKPHEKKLKAALQDLAEAKTPLRVVDGAMATQVSELVLLCRELRPDIVYVDGAYLLRHPDKTLTRFPRMAEVCDQLKSDIGVDCAVPAVGSWQFKRDYVSRRKQGDKGKRTLDDVYGSDVIAQNSSVVVGLFQPDSPETLHRRIIEILKGRGGESGRFAINWHFRKMDFSQTLPEGAESKEKLKNLG